MTLNLVEGNKNILKHEKALLLETWCTSLSAEAGLKRSRSKANSHVSNVARFTKSAVCFSMNIRASAERRCSSSTHSLLLLAPYFSSQSKPAWSLLITLWSNQLRSYSVITSTEHIMSWENRGESRVQFSFWVYTVLYKCIKYIDFVPYFVKWNPHQETQFPLG